MQHCTVPIFSQQVNMQLTTFIASMGSPPLLADHKERTEETLNFFGVDCKVAVLMKLLQGHSCHTYMADLAYHADSEILS